MTKNTPFSIPSMLKIGLALTVLTIFAQTRAMGNTVEVVSDKDPQQLVQNLLGNIIHELNVNRTLYENNLSKTKEFAQNQILPYFDTVSMAKFILGRAVWRSSSEQQKQAFIQTLSDLVISSYASSLLKLRIERVEVGRPVYSRKNRVAKISASVFQEGNNEPTKIESQLIRNKQKIWKVYDASIKGISILISYRKTYSGEIEKKGLDRVIQDMRDKIAQTQ